MEGVFVGAIFNGLCVVLKTLYDAIVDAVVVIQYITSIVSERNV